MTLEQVMGLEGAALNEAVAEKLNYAQTNRGTFRKCDDGSGWESVVELPDFAGDWNAAMQVREWARGLPRAQQRAFLTAVECCAEKRLGPFRKGWIVMDMEAIDLLRASLLVMP